MPTSSEQGKRLRILVVQTAFLGDVVLTTPLLRELRRAQPAAEITVLTTATGRSALDGLPWVDRWLVLDKAWDGPGRRSYRALIAELLRSPFDAAVAAQRSVRTGVILRLSRARLRVGFAGAPGAWAYNRRVCWAADRHAVERYLDLAAPLGGRAESADRRPELAVASDAAARVACLLARHRVDPEAPLLCVAPGSVWATKRWVPEGYAAVLREAPARGLLPVLVGAPEERPLCLEVASLAGPVPVLAGETSVPELVALLARARMVVSNDSGAAHVASAVGTPVVSVFGSTVPTSGYTAFGPHAWVVERAGLACRPCGRHGFPTCPLGHFRCMREVPAARVLERIDALLGATGAALGRPAAASQQAGRAPG